MMAADTREPIEWHEDNLRRERELLAAIGSCLRVDGSSVAEQLGHRPTE